MADVDDPDDPKNDKHLKTARIVLGQHPELYHFLINPVSHWLRKEPEILSKNSEAFSSGERILISVTLDLCFNHSTTRLSDVISRLDPENFKNVITALKYLRVAKRY